MILFENEGKKQIIQKENGIIHCLFPWLEGESAPPVAGGR